MAVVAQSVITSTAPKLREASFDDYAQIAALQRERGLRVRSREKWRHLWEANPAYLDLGRKWPIGWVLEAANKIVGYCGNIPARYELDGKPLIAACGYSWVVEPAYSSYSMLLLYEYLRQENAAVCISTTAGPISYKAHMALGAVPIPVGDLGPFRLMDYQLSRFCRFLVGPEKMARAACLLLPRVGGAVCERRHQAKGKKNQRRPWSCGDRMLRAI